MVPAAFSPNDVLTFWFEEISESQWWTKDLAFDEQIKARFLSLHKKAVAGELAQWRTTPGGALAEIIVLDQFSRNIFRDRPEAFAQDAQALTLAQVAVSLGFHLELPDRHRPFMLLPFMHSESAVIHQQSLPLFKACTPDNTYQFELQHKAIIDRFGRYPHRNTILGRDSTAEETEFLTQPNSSF